MKIHVLYKTTENTTGGGNQFLRSLKNFFKSINIYEENRNKADVVLFNSHHFVKEAAGLKFSRPDKIFIQRIDGPMKKYNNNNDRRDDIVNIANRFIADATVFQSEWSQDQNHLMGMPEKEYETVIHNAPDPEIYYKAKSNKPSEQNRIRLIATSWSVNPNKGFGTYKWLDENLDFSKYEMFFIGRSDIKFENINDLGVMSSTELAEQLRKSDIFIFASLLEACSNSLLEAMHCGLPVVAANSSSNPKIVGRAGELFNSPEEIPHLIEKISGNYNYYTSNITNPSIKDVGTQYLMFAENVYKNHGHEKGKFGLLNYLNVSSRLLSTKIGMLADGIFNK